MIHHDQVDCVYVGDCKILIGEWLEVLPDKHWDLMWGFRNLVRVGFLFQFDGS